MILVTGGTGYIGSHVIRELIKRGHNPNQIYSLDKNLHSPNREVVEGYIRGVFNYDILSPEGLEILERGYDAIIHLAAYISVEESTRIPTTYWRNNLLSTNRVIDNVGGAHLVFASTGTAYCPENAYAYSKLACEEEITSRLQQNYTNFRFYNVSGMAEGHQPTGQPTHLIRRAAMAAVGTLPEMTVYGSDWMTPDETCVRDYIHVEDIAASIVNAVEFGPSENPFECLGSGTGYSVLQVIESMKRVSGVDFQVTMADRRPGDVASMICPSQYHLIALSHDLDSMCLSAYEGLKNAEKLSK